MAISFLKVIQNFGKRQPSRAVRRHYLMLAGISQTLFLKNWGDPDTQVSLKRVGNLRQGSLYLRVDSEDDAHYSVWIYKERDHVLFFSKKKLVVHFKWSVFDGRRKQLKGGTNVHGMGIRSALLGVSVSFPLR